MGEKGSPNNWESGQPKGKLRALDNIEKTLLSAKLKLFKAEILCLTVCDYYNNFVL